MKSTPFITFINPPGLYNPKNLSKWGPTPPFGLAYIVSSTRANGYKFKVIDAVGEKIHSYRKFSSSTGEMLLNGLNIEEILQRVDKRSNIFAISHTFLHQWPFISDLCLELKKWFPKSVIVLGGENASGLNDYILKNNRAVDYCVLGEGEESFLNILKRYPDEKSIRATEGISFVLKDTVVKTTSPKRISNLDDLPKPAWDEFPMDQYFQISDGHGYHKGRSISIQATRGCPYHCTFCSAPGFWTVKYHMRTAKDVVQEMKDLKDRYQIKNFNFTDLTLIANINWFRSLCEEIIKENLNITWQLPSGTRSEILKDDILTLMKESGCDHVCFAPETGSKELQVKIKKRVNLDKLKKVQKLAQSKNMRTEANFIIGHPLETRKDLWKSFLYMFKLIFQGLNDSSPIIFSPYPGSEDFKNLVKEGKIKFNEEYFYCGLNRMGNATSSYNPNISRRELYLYQYFFLVVGYSINFIIRPQRVFKMIQNLFVQGESGQIEKGIKKRLFWLKTAIVLKFKNKKSDGIERKADVWCKNLDNYQGL